MEIYKNIGLPILDRIGKSEEVHGYVRSGLQWMQQDPLRFDLFKQAFSSRVFDDPRLSTDFFGTELRNPLILAAGWTKNGEALEALAALGFGAIDVGAVLENPQVGNPKVRQWAHGDKAVNWIGLASNGLRRTRNMVASQHTGNIPLLVNIANNENVAANRAAKSFAVVAEGMKDYAKGFEVCVCPNRDETLKFRDYDVLLSINQAVKQTAGEIPVFLKLLPGMSDQERYDFVRAGEDAKIEGFTTSNTSTSPGIKDKYAFSRGKPGGFSGNDPEYKAMVLDDIAFVRRESSSSKKIIACGGIQTGIDAFNALQAGGDYIQGNTFMRARGLYGPRYLLEELLDIMDQEKVGHYTKLRDLDN